MAPYLVVLADSRARPKSVIFKVLNRRSSSLSKASKIKTGKKNNNIINISKFRANTLLVKTRFELAVSCILDFCLYVDYSEIIEHTHYSFNISFHGCFHVKIAFYFINCFHAS